MGGQGAPTETGASADGRRARDIVFVVDCSGSMAGERIGALNWAMKTLVPALRAHAEEHGDVALRAQILHFATGAAFATPHPEAIERFAWSNLQAGGESDMGTAFRLLAASFEGSPRPPDAPAPVIVLVSDGFPSDDAEGGLAALLATEAGRGATRIPIAIGQDADMALLRAFASDPAAPPLRSHDVESLIGRMRLGAGARPAAASPKIAAAAGSAEDEDLW